MARTRQALVAFVCYAVNKKARSGGRAFKGGNVGSVFSFLVGTGGIFLGAVLVGAVYLYAHRVKAVEGGRGGVPVVVVADLYVGRLGLHRVEEGLAGGIGAAVVAYLQDVGLKVGAELGDHRGLHVGLGVAGEEHGGVLVGDLKGYGTVVNNVAVAAADGLGAGIEDLHSRVPP